jgi:hypothetical protein
MQKMRGPKSQSGMLKLAEFGDVGSLVLQAYLIVIVTIRA